MNNRNHPCHCGSGKKYKKCHLMLDEGFKADGTCAHKVGRKIINSVDMQPIGQICAKCGLKQMYDVGNVPSL